MHETKVLIQIVKIVVLTFACNATVLEEAIGLFYRPEGLAILDNGKDTDKPLGNGIGFQDIKCGLLFREFCRSQADEGPGL